jgi:hypothetical protein
MSVRAGLNPIYALNTGKSGHKAIYFISKILGSKTHNFFFNVGK